MDAEWLTYREAAKRLGSNIEAVRQRAIRSRWPRTMGNDKRARIQIPDGLTNPSQEGNDRGSRHPLREGNDRAYDRPLERPFIKALEAHVETLKEQLTAAEARLAQNVADLAAEKAKTEKAIEAFAAIAERLDALAAQHATRPWWQRLLRSAG
jgi:hypothetical protein